MDFQLIAVIIVFVLALLYVGKMAYNGLKNKSACASNCGKCGVDFSQLTEPEK